MTSVPPTVSGGRHTILGSLSHYLIIPGSKEEDRRIVIMEEATRKRIKVNFILTGHCSDNQLEEQAVYYEIADATSGFVSSTCIFIKCGPVKQGRARQVSPTKE